MRAAGNWPARIRRDTVRSDTRRYRATSALVSRSAGLSVASCGVAALATGSGFSYTHDGRSKLLMDVEAAGACDGFLVFLSNIRELRICPISGHRHNLRIVGRGLCDNLSAR